MAQVTFRFGAALALVAGLTMAASPAMARDRHHHHRHGIDAGDVIAGALIIGGIAAIASAASKPKEPKVVYREPYPDTRPEYRPEYGPRAPVSDRYVGGGIDNAVDMCVDQVERGEERVDSVDNASRTSDGWRISGLLAAGGAFSCWIDNDGRIRNVDLGGDYYGASYDEPASAQYDDETYARARAQLRDEYAEAPASDYDYDDIDADLAASDY